MWPLDEGARWQAGVGLAGGALGFGGEARWLGFLVGPAATLSVRPWEAAVELGLRASFDMGRLPVCNNWPDGALCIRYWGFYPRAETSVAYAFRDDIAISAAFGVRYVTTLAWTGASIEPALRAQYSW